MDNNGWIIEVVPEVSPTTNTNPERHTMNTEANINSININVVFTDDQMQQFAERVAKAIVENHMSTLHEEIEDHIDHSHIAEQVEQHIDYDKLAEQISGEIDASDVATHIDIDDLAAEIDKEDVARMIVHEYGDELSEGVAQWYDKDQMIDDLIKQRINNSDNRLKTTENYLQMLLNQISVLRETLDKMPSLGLEYMNDLNKQI